MIGSYGNRCANMALANADLVLALGTRLDTRQTGTKLPTFIRSGRVIRVDIDENEIIHHRLSNVDGVVSDIKDFIEEVAASVTVGPRPQWLAFVRTLKTRFNQGEEINRNVLNRRPYVVMSILNRYATDDQTYTADIGQNQMFAAQTLVLKDAQRWKTSGGLAPMGFALPSAIGASFAAGKSGDIFAITGDGGLQMSLQSLMLLSQHGLPIKIILLNNRSLGMITQFQDLYFDSRKEGTTRESGYLVPDFSNIAKAYGLRYHVVQDAGFEDEKSLARIMKEPGPALIEFEVGEMTVVCPKLEVNMPIEDISPRLSREELAANMIIEAPAGE
jgi:acetolactate synthase-1/2/3 large subunit